MNFFRCFLTYHLVRAHTVFRALFWEWWNKKWEKKSLTCNIKCVCVCGVCQQEASKHSNNRLNKSLRVFCAWYLLSQCAMTDSCQTAVMSLRSGDWQLQTGSGPCGETETTCTIWGWKCRLKVFYDEERGLDRAHRFIKSRLMLLQRHFTENIDLCHHLKQKAPRYDECLWRRRIHNMLMIYRAVSSHV